MKAARIPLVAVLAWLSAAGVSLAQFACSAAAFGPSTQDPITISGTWTVCAGSTLDFGPRRVVLAPTAVVTVSHATILASKFTMQPGSSIVAAPSASSAFLSVTSAAGGLGSGEAILGGTIDLQFTALPPAVTIAASNDVIVTGPISARGYAGFLPPGPSASCR